MLEQKEITIGENSFQFNLMNAWDANSTLLQLKPLLMPAAGSLSEKDAMNQDAIKLISGIVNNLTEELFESVVFKLFARSSLICTNKGKKITNKAEFCLVFDGASGLIDAYKLIFEVLKANYSGFFTGALADFGAQTSTEPQISIPRTLAQ